MSSEREAAFGGLNPNKVISHGGKDYVFRPVLSEGTLNAIEQTMFDRELQALKAVKDAMSETEYRAELTALRKKKSAGDFSFANPDVLAFFETNQGSLLLIGALCTNADAGELLGLLMQRIDDVKELLEDIIEVSFPPKA